MIYNKAGDILWSRGRHTVGKHIDDGNGFSKSYIKQTLESGASIDTEDVLIDLSHAGLSDSFMALCVKNLLITPISNDFFLYIDSGRKQTFSQQDRIVFRMLGELLGEIINRIETDQKKAGGITGSSEATEKLRKMILKFALETEPVLLLGETGTGKSHIAALIHKYSGRNGRLVIADTPTIQENLFESLMFGHKKGAFTDAAYDRKGLVMEAEKGTLFIDEIAEVPLSFQAKLLRFIETRKYMVLGDTKEREADIRIVAATNVDLRQAIENKLFREDLYYRLHILELTLPPLRERKKDIENLVKENISFLKGKDIGGGFWDAMLNHQWPGNIRELVTVLKRIGIYSASPVTGKEVEAILATGIYQKKIHKDIRGDAGIKEAVQAGKDFWELVWKPFLNRDFDRRTVKRLLKDAYRENGESFKKMTAFFNLPVDDYHKFMALMHKYRLDPRS
ncbi:MAG: sigma-54-dependent Fis family transcriptional regulator [bacterium]|nr:sigma-54-dependent Fis family transcriptional regulator [bacterium]